MSMADGEGQRVGGIWPGQIDTGQLHPHHMRNRPVIRMPNADNRLVHRVGCVFTDLQTGLRQRKHGNAPRLAQLERGRAVLIHERGLDGGAIRGETLNNVAEGYVQIVKPQGQITLRRRG